MICPKCGFNNPEDYGFCLRCAYEFKDNDFQRRVLCPYCGNITHNLEECDFCHKKLDKDSLYKVVVSKKTNTPMSSDDIDQILNNISIDSKNNLSNKKVNEIQIIEEKNPANNFSFRELLSANENLLAIILGYIFSILGGVLGFIFAFYNITRKNVNTKFHGLYQLFILSIYILVLPFIFKRPDIGILGFSISVAFILTVFKSITMEFDEKNEDSLENENK